MFFICFSSGSSGIPVKLVTNLFSLDLPQDWKLYQYHVTYMPDLESRSLRIALLYSQKELSNKAKAFDGVILFLSEQLEERVQYDYFVIHTHTHTCAYTNAHPCIFMRSADFPDSWNEFFTPFFFPIPMAESKKTS